MTKPKTQPTELSQRIRVLLKEGRSTQEIMALTNARKHIVGLVKYHMERQENLRISPTTGKPVRKYTKRKKVKAEVKAKPKKNPLIDERNMLLWDRKRLKDELSDAAETLMQLRQEIAALRNRRPIEVEIPVPQPFSHYTFMQRLRILFLGGAA